MTPHTRSKALACLTIACCLANRINAETENTTALKIATHAVADYLDADLKTFEASVKALGNAFVRLRRNTPPPTPAERGEWLANAKNAGATTLFHPGKTTPKKYQSPFPSFLYYGEGTPSKEVWRDLQTFVPLALPFQTAFETFNDSWVYLTTVNGAFLIYPHLPLEKATSNYPPNQQIFYTSANFKNKTAGWTPPYLDLVGAGMMVTVCFPVYDGDTLLGVASRDLTLNQLASQALRPEADAKGALVCFIIDENGLAIANSDAGAMREIDEVNRKAKAAVLRYVESKDLKASKNAKAVNSKNAILNQIGSAVLKQVDTKPNAKTWNVNVTSGKRSFTAHATKIPSAGWLVIAFQ